MMATYNPADVLNMDGIAPRPRKRTSKRSQKVVTFGPSSNVQQYQQTIPLYSSIASGAQSPAGKSSKSSPTKQNKSRRRYQPPTNGMVHSGDPPASMNPKHRSVTGQYFVRYATENPNYPSRARPAAAAAAAPVYGYPPYPINSVYPPQTAAAQPGYGYGAGGAYARSTATYPPTLYPQQTMGGVHGVQQYPLHSMYPQNMNGVHGVNGVNSMNTLNAMQSTYPMNGVHPVRPPMNTMNGMNGVYPMATPQSMAQQQPNVPHQLATTRMYPPPTRPVPAVPTPSNQYAVQLNQYGNASSSDDTVDSVKTPPKPVAVPIPQSDGSKPKPIGAGKEQFGLCPMFGSAKGCKWGGDCFYKHSDPNSVPFCPDFHSPDGCYFGDSCFNRHQTFVFVKRGDPIPQFYPQKAIESKEVD